MALDPKVQHVKPKAEKGKQTDPKRAFCERLQALGFNTRYSFVLFKDGYEAISVYQGLTFESSGFQAKEHTVEVARLLTEHDWTLIDDVQPSDKMLGLMVLAYDQVIPYSDWPKKEEK